MDKGVFAVGIEWKYQGNDCEKRVYPHYKSLKEEMLNYKYLQFKHIQQIMIKAKAYYNTNVVKSMKAGPLEDGDPMSVNAIICMIMYCDYTDLSRDFTLSFRKSNPFQPISQIKKHNSLYYHWSKILKQTITDYGQWRNDHVGGRGKLPRLVGPFYSGLSAVLTLSQFTMYIHSPLSTSAHLEVAVVFADEEGMILELDHKIGYAMFLRGMDVSWLSRYREEDERCV